LCDESLFFSHSSCGTVTPVYPEPRRDCALAFSSPPLLRELCILRDLCVIFFLLPAKSHEPVSFNLNFSTLQPLLSRLPHNSVRNSSPSASINKLSINRVLPNENGHHRITSPPHAHHRLKRLRIHNLRVVHPRARLAASTLCMACCNCRASRTPETHFVCGRPEARETIPSPPSSPPHSNTNSARTSPARPPRARSGRARSPCPDSNPAPLLHHARLLRILAPEIRKVRLHNLQQLQHNGGHPAKMARA